MGHDARLASYYFCYYAALGAFTPYFARWVIDSGHGALAASACLALWYGTRVLAPPSWSWLCARSAQPLRWLQGGSLLAAGAFAGLLLFDSLAGVLLTTALFSFFANAVMPQFEAHTLEQLGSRRADYGRIRLWGSLGFLLVAAGYGPLLDAIGGDWLPALMWPLLLATAASAWLQRDARAGVRQAPGSEGLRAVLAAAEVRRFLLMAMLMQVGFGPFYVFFTVHLGNAGHDGHALGTLWAAGVLAEIAMFWSMAWVFRQIEASVVLAICLAVTTLRWAVVAVWPESFPWMFGMQLLHAISFGAFHAACMQRVSELFPGRLAQHGQSLLYAFSSGLGGVGGTLLAGLIWDQLGAAATFVAASAICGLGFALAWPRKTLDRTPASH